MGINNNNNTNESQTASNELQTVLNSILADKEANLKPGNLKKGIKCLGITGTLEASTSSGVKQFSTVEEMNSSTGNTEGDLAIVYRDEAESVSNGDTITSITFPQTVVFDTAIASDYYGTLQSESTSFQLNISLGTSYCNIFDRNQTIPYINYTSTDGITYIRTDNNDDTYEIEKTTISDLDEHICKFIQVGGNVFEGLYQYRTAIDRTYFKMCKIATKQTSSYTNQPYLNQMSILDGTHIRELISNALKEINWTIDSFTLIKKSDTLFTAYGGGNSTNAKLQQSNFGYTDNKTYVRKTNYSSPKTDRWLKFEIDLSNDSCIMSDVEETITVNPSVGTAYTAYEEVTNYEITMDTLKGDTSANCITIVTSLSGTTSIVNMSIDIEAPVRIRYLLTSNQLNAVATEIMSGKIVYTSKGITTGVLTDTISSGFDDTMGQIYAMTQFYYDTLPTIELSSDSSTNAYYPSGITCIPLRSNGSHIFDISKATHLDWCIQECQHLHTIVGIDTSNITSANNMFYVYTKNSLVNIPVMDFSKVTEMSGMVTGCINLSDASLNNLMATMLTAKSYTGTKTLKYLGLSQDQATKCKTLSNYSAFTAAGWTTGY